MDALLLRLVHSPPVLLRAPIISQCKAMNLLFINPQLMGQARLLRHQILNLSHGSIIQKTVLIANSQTQWLCNRIEVAWDGDKRGMACIYSIDVAVCCENRISSSPTEPNCANFSGSRNCSNSSDEGFNDRLVTPSRCLTTHGPRVAPIVVVALVLSSRVSCARGLRGGSIELRNSTGRESPWCTSGM
jgi:hypothetical protein